jgi:hypothetical protein
MCGEAKMPEVGGWLRQLEEGALGLPDVTDGKGTNHIPAYYAEVLTKWDERLFMKLYRRVTSEARGRDLPESLAEGFAASANLARVQNREFLKKNMTYWVFKALARRSGEPNGHAEAICKEYPLMRSRLDDDRRRDEASYSSAPLSGAGPTPPAFPPPDRVDAFSTSLSSLPVYERQGRVRDWLRHWGKSRKPAVIVKMIEGLLNRGVEVEKSVPAFDACVSVRGKDEAFPWLIDVAVDMRVLSGWACEEQVAQEVWERVRLHYPERWQEFIQSVYLCKRKPRIEPIITVAPHFARITSFLLAVGRRSVARDVVGATVRFTAQTSSVRL